MQKNTTGAAVSRFAVLTCLAYNRLSEHHLDDEEREAAIAEIVATLRGECGIATEKLIERSGDRCFIGGALMSVNGAGFWGAN